MQKVIISPDSSKECMSALWTSEVIKETIEKEYPYWSVGILLSISSRVGTLDSSLKNGEDNLIFTVRNIMKLISFRQVSVNE